MSDYTAIGGVSRTLRTLLLDRMETPAPQVTIAPPDVAVAGVSGRRLNLYLYQVTENGYLKNQEIPGHGHPAAYGHPPLSLDLHYLLTAYGSSETAVDADLDAQQVLGDAMRVLHDFAIVTAGLEITRPAAGTVGDPILDPSLQSEFERVKTTLQPATLEEFSKIWTALPQANFRRSVAYQVSVVQIESRSPRRLAMPVRTRRVHVAILRRPQITAVYRTPMAPGDPVGDLRVGILQQITIEGLNFLASRTWVRLGGLEPIQLAPLSDDRIQSAVPDDKYPADADNPLPRPIPPESRLQPGPQVVEVSTRRDTEVVEGGLDKGQVVSDQSVYRSNQAVFMLVPEISPIPNPSPPPPMLPAIEPTSGPNTILLTVRGKRLYKEGLKSFVLVGDVAIEVRKPGAGDSWAAPTETSVQVPLLALSGAVPLPPPAGQPYPVRIQVNGAQSTEEGITFTLMP